MSNKSLKSRNANFQRPEMKEREKSISEMALKPALQQLIG